MKNTLHMKRLFIFSTFLLLLLSTTFPQQSGNTIKPNLKYGKPSKEELSLNSYAPDTTATAIYLFRMGESKFVYKDGFQLVNPEKPDVPLNKNDAFQKVQKRRVQEKR